MRKQKLTSTHPVLHGPAESVFITISANVSEDKLGEGGGGPLFSVSELSNNQPTSRKATVSS